MMRPDAKVEKVYLYPKSVDFRKSIDGLAALVELDADTVGLGIALVHAPFDGIARHGTSHGAQHRSGRAAAAAANLVSQNAAHQATEHSAPARRVAALGYLHNVNARDTTVLGWIRLLRLRGIRLVVLARWRSARRQRRGQNDACNQREPAGDGRHEILLWCGSRRSRRRCAWWMG